MTALITAILAFFNLSTFADIINAILSLFGGGAN